MSVALKEVIQEKVERLSPQRQAEVIDFIEFLLSREKPQEKRKLTFSGAGGPADSPVNMTSVELQHEALEQREADAQPAELPSQRHRPTFDWVDDDNAEPEPLTSVELQHRAAQWVVEKLEKNLAQP